MNTMKKRLGGLAAGAMLAAGLATGGAILAGTPAEATDTLSAASARDCSYSPYEPVLRRGSRGPEVQQAQCQLNGAMYQTYLAEDGQFGPATDAAVRKFQRCMGLAVDGIIGPNTWRELNYWWINGPRWCG